MPRPGPGHLKGCARCCNVSPLVRSSSCRCCSQRRPRVPRSRSSTSTPAPPAAQVGALVALGVDRHELQMSRRRRAGARSQVRVETILSGAPGGRSCGARASARRRSRSAARRRRAGHAQAARTGFEVFRPYSGAGGIQAEFEQIAADEPGASPSSSPSARPLNGPGHRRAQGDRERAAGARTARSPPCSTSAPSTPASGSRRRWSAGCLHHVVDGYGTDPRDHPARQRERAVVRPGRQPRRLRLHVHSPASGCGARTCATTTATARSRRATASTSTATSRPTGATTTRARRRTRRARPTAAPARPPSPRRRRSTSSPPRRPRVLRQLPLRGRAAAVRHGLAGRHAVARRRPLRGDGRRRRRPRRPRLRPRHLRRAVHHQRRHRHAHAERYGTLGFTPEMSTCESASDVDPDDEWEADGLRQRVQLPRRRGADPGRVREEHPVRARRSPSRPSDPDDPVSVVGRDGRGLPRRLFDVSYGDPQTVAVVAKRALKGVALHYRINGGRTRTAGVSRVARRRALRRRERRLLRRVPRPGARRRPRRRGRGLVQRPRSAAAVAGRQSEHFTYTVGADTRRRRARDRQRGLHGRQPGLPAGHDRAEVRRRARRRARGRRLRRRRLGRRRAGRAARPRRAQPLRRRALVPRATTG